MKTLPLGPFLGENNRLPDYDLHVDKVGDFLSRTLNIDIDNKGNIRRGQATKLIQALTGAHSLHMVSATTGYVMQDAILYPLTIVGETVTLGSLIKILGSAASVSWLQDGADLYYSNGTDSGRITAGVWYPLGIITPAAPALTLIAGALLPGWYQVGVSYSNSVTGEESGISAASSLELAATSGVRVTLPTATPGADTINVYLSAANGSVVYRLESVASGTTTYDCTALASGRESTGRFEAPLPAGRLFMSNNRLCSIVGKAIYVGSPWRYGYHLPAESYIAFPEPVSVAIEAQGGTYIVAGKTHWFPGSDLSNVEAMIQDVAPHGAVPGTEFVFPDRTTVGWFGTLGIMFGDTQGQVVEVMNDNIDLTPPAIGCSAVLQSNGYMRVVSCGWCVNLENKAATRYSGWDFTSLSGSYGTKADGIYLIEATGTVDSLIGLGKQDFSTESQKHLPAVYVGMASLSPMELTIAYVDEGDIDREYAYLTRSCSDRLQEQRFDPGKGIRANWLDLTLCNTDGADFTLASVSFAPTFAARRL